MNDLISRNEAREIIADMRGLFCNDILCDAMAKINALPSVSAVQEPVEPKKVGPLGCWQWHCGVCGMAVEESDNYCHECGREVKWE